MKRKSFFLRKGNKNNMLIKQKRAQSSYNLVFFKYVYVADFLKTNVTKTAVIAVKKRQMACFVYAREAAKLY